MASNSTKSVEMETEPIVPVEIIDPNLLLDNIKHNLTLLNRAVTLLEPRFTRAALKSIPALRKKLGKDGEELAHVIKSGNIYPNDSTKKTLLLNYLGNPAPPVHPVPVPVESKVTPTTSETSMDVDSVPVVIKVVEAATEKVEKATIGKKEKAVEVEPLAVLPEGDIFVSLLVVLYLLDNGKLIAGKELVASLLSTTVDLNRRTMDQLASKLYFYWVRFHELNGDDTGLLRTPLLAAQRTAALRHDDDLQATLLPLLLRNYLEHHLYDQADRLLSKTTFPEGTAGNAQLARYYYYVGRIRAIQLNYTEAHSNLQQAIRRAPDAKVAPGFLQTAYKLSIVVELLMGEIPERSTFRQPVLKSALQPYLEIVQAVRTGSITEFNEALTTHSASFDSSSNTSLILRLRHNVIKTALRTLSLSYSKISLSDIRAKLNLDSEEDAEYIVAKAIKDGVIRARIERGGGGYMESKREGDVYATGEPMMAFDTRIKFLLELHNQSVKAMRYPLHAHSKELASASEAREREKELAKEIAETEDDDLDADGEGGGGEGF